jgi:hypothetical protein
MRRVLSVLYWAAVVVLAAFGLYFTFTNYPVFGIVFLLSIVALIVYSERSRRQRQRASEDRRRRSRASQSGPAGS